MREFLKGLELDQETIDTIMAEYGKNITLMKETIDDYKQQIANYDDKIKEYDNKIEELNGVIESDKENFESLQNVANENKDLKNQLQMSNSDVKKEFLKFVTSEVASNVNDEVDFATALNNYKQENPQYFGETVVKKVQSSPSVSNGGQQPTTTNDIMNNILRGNNE